MRAMEGGVMIYTQFLALISLFRQRFFLGEYGSHNSDGEHSQQSIMIAGESTSVFWSGEGPDRC